MSGAKHASQARYGEVGPARPSSILVRFLRNRLNKQDDLCLLFLPTAP